MMEFSWFAFLISDGISMIEQKTNLAVPRESDLPGDIAFLLLRLLPPLMDREIHGGAQDDALSKVG